MNIQGKSLKGFGLKQSNQKMMSFDSKLLHDSTVSGISIFSSGIQFRCSTMCGLGSVPTFFGTTVGVFPPCKMFLKDIPPFLCFCCGSVLFFVIVLVPLPPSSYFLN